MKPPAPNLRDQALGWAEVFREDWQECRDDPAYAPTKAWSLLAAWGALCRFFPPEALPAEASAVSAVVHHDAAALLAALPQTPEPAEWIERARNLHRAWDFAACEEVVRELERAAIMLFDELDRNSLAACMAARLAPDGATAERLAAWRQQAEEAEGWFRNHVAAFLPTALLARATLAACRSSLEEDEALWDTVLKHRLLEEAAEELEADPPPRRLSESDKQALQAKVDRARSNGLAQIVPAQWQGRQILVFSRRVLPPQLLAAAAPAGTELPELLALRLRSPKETVEARLFLPAGVAPVDGSEVIRLNCYDIATGKEVLAKKTVSLAGIERSLDDRGRVSFTLRELCETGQDLFVIIDGEPYTPESRP